MDRGCNTLSHRGVQLRAGLQLSCGGVAEWRRRTHTLLSLSALLVPACLGPASRLSITARPGIKSAGAQSGGCARQTCQQAGRKNSRGAQKPQSAAIKVLLCRGERTRRPPEGRREIQLPACHISSARVILGNKRARTHLYTGCRDPGRDCGQGEKNLGSEVKLNFCFIIVGTN